MPEKKTPNEKLVQLHDEIHNEKYAEDIPPSHAVLTEDIAVRFADFVLQQKYGDTSELFAEFMNQYKR